MIVPKRYDIVKYDDNIDSDSYCRIHSISAKDDEIYVILQSVKLAYLTDVLVFIPLEVVTPIEYIKLSNEEVRDILLLKKMKEEYNNGKPFNIVFPKDFTFSLTDLKISLENAKIMDLDCEDYVIRVMLELARNENYYFSHYDDEEDDKDEILDEIWSRLYKGDSLFNNQKKYTENQIISEILYDRINICPIWTMPFFDYDMYILLIDKIIESGDMLC